MDQGIALEVVRQLLATAQVFLRESQRLFRPHGLSATQYNVLSMLAEHPAGLSQRELSELLVVDRSNVTGLLDRMGEAGWVQRLDDPADRRAHRVVLTTAGRRLQAAVQPIYHAAAAEVVGRLSVTGAKHCAAALRALEASAAAWGGRLAAAAAVPARVKPARAAKTRAGKC